MINRILIALSLTLIIAGSLSAQDVVATHPDNLQPITPDNAAQLQEIVRIGNGVFNRGIAYSPDGAALAVGGSLGIWVYDANDLNAPPTLIDLDAPVYDVEFSHDGRYLVYGMGGEGGVHVMDFSTREEVLRVEGLQFALHPDGDRLAVSRLVFEDAENCDSCAYYPHWVIEVWSIEDGELLRTIEEDSVSNAYKFMSYVAGIVFSPDGQTLAITLSGFIDDACADTPKLLILLDMPFDPDVQPAIVRERVGGLFVADGSLFVGTTNSEYPWNSGSVFVWDVETQQERLILDDDNPDESVQVDYLALSPDNEIITATADNRLLQWNLQTGEPASDVAIEALFLGVAYSPDGSQIVALTPTALQVWDSDLNSHQTINLAGAFATATIHPSARLITTQDTAAQIRMWVLDLQEVIEYALPNDLSYRISQNGEVLVYLTNGALYVWNASRPVEEALAIEGEFSSEDRLVLSENGLWLAQWTTEGHIQLWNLGSGELISQLEDDFPQGASITFSPNAEMIATTEVSEEDDEGRRESVFRLWNTQTGEQLYAVDATLNNNASTLGGGFSSDNRRLSVSVVQQRGESATYETRILSIPDFNLINSFTEQGSRHLMRDFQTMIVDSGDQYSVHLNVYSVDTGEQLSDTPFHGFDTGGIIGISRDGSRLLVETANVYSQCGGYIHRLYLVAVPSMQTLLDRGLQIIAYDASLNNLESQVFSHNSRLLAVSDGYSITIYNAQDGTVIVELDKTVSREAYFNPDDTLIVTTGEDGTIRLYGVLPEGE